MRDSQRIRERQLMTTENFQPTLAELILTQKGLRTYRALSADCGGIPTDSRLNSLVKSPIKNFPDVDTIRGLSIGLRVNISDIILASARSLDLQVGPFEPGILKIPGAGHLPPSAKEALAAAAFEMLKIQQQVAVKKDFTEYQAQLRQDFAAGARLRRVPATEIEAALQGPGWYMVTADDDSLTVTDSILGWSESPNIRQLKAALRDVLADSRSISQGDVELAADKGQLGLHPEDDIAPA